MASHLHSYPAIHTLSITRFPWNNFIRRSAFTKHLPQISNQLVRFLMCSEMTSGIMLRLKNHITLPEPSEKEEK